MLFYPLFRHNLNKGENMRVRTLLLLSAFLGFFFTHSFSYSQGLKPEEIFEKYSDAIVVIHAYDFNGDPLGQGSGVILNDKGLLVTNFHIFSGGEKMVLIHKEDTIKYTDIVGVDVEKDVLILKLERNDFPNIPIGDSDGIKIGEEVYAIGSPMGLENTITKGIVSGYRATLGDLKQGFVQIDASLSPGSSGGAVLNSKGELIGISTLGIRGGQNLNFAIPINTVMGVDLGSYSDKKKLDALNYFYQAKNLFEVGQNEEAIDYYTRYLEMFPKDHKGYNYRGLAYFERKQYDKALKDFNKSISIDGAFAPAYNNRGQTYFRMEENEKAIKDFTRVIKFFPDNVEAYYARGVVYMSEEDLEEAVKDFDKVIKAEPDYTTAYVNRGICHYKDKEFELAIADWKYAIKLDPSLRDDLQPLINNADALWQYNY